MNAPKLDFEQREQVERILQCSDDDLWNEVATLVLAAAQLAEKKRLYAFCEVHGGQKMQSCPCCEAVHQADLREAAEQRIQEAQAEIERQLNGWTKEITEKHLLMEQLKQTLDACGKHAEQAEHDAQHAEAIVEKASAYCTICDGWRGDDSDGATSLRRKAFMELAEAVHAALPSPPKEAKS